MAEIYSNILETVGNTPVVKINKLAPEGIDLYVKIEAFNPMGSVKDRLALNVIEQAEKDGTLSPGQTVVEATSGNTGIVLAMVCAQKGYPLVIVMAENFSVERRKLMRFLGADVVLTPAAEKGTGMLAKAVELAETHGWFLARQFENEANADAHSNTTAPEILDAFEGKKLDYWVSGYGTGGTLKGVARVLKEKRPEIKVIACEPDNAPLLGSGISQPLNDDGSVAESHPFFRPHLMQGWTTDFIPKLVSDVVDDELIDEIVPIDGAESLRLSKELALQEGIFVGISGGATLAGALEIAKKAPKGSSILCMLPDTGERYLSTTLFEDVPVDMTKKEIEISRSTPRYHFGATPPPPAPAQEEEVVAAKAEALAFVEKAISNPDEPVVMFALEWCEFCWSVRKMFAEFDIPYRSIDLDSVEYQKENLGGDIRVALKEQISSPTIPQIFVGKEYIGGCTETFDAFNEGKLQGLLKSNAVAFKEGSDVDAYSFLPTWLHPR
ncbi:MAG: cysteine synthase A [Rhodospirillaceae bacterium]|nr:cysteine synthase A [Rhodospirillaceae bacterium]